MIKLQIELTYDEAMRLCQTAEHGALHFVQQSLSQPDSLGAIATIATEASRLIADVKSQVETAKRKQELDAPTVDVDALVREDDERRKAE